MLDEGSPAGCLVPKPVSDNTGMAASAVSGPLASQVGRRKNLVHPASDCDAVAGKHIFNEVFRKCNESDSLLPFLSCRSVRTLSQVMYRSQLLQVQLSAGLR